MLPFKDYDARVDFRHGLPKAGEIEKLGNALVILDDMMAEVDEKVANVLTHGSHHKKIFPTCSRCRTLTFSSFP